MVDVFISYSRNNRDRVRLLADAVKAIGYVVWWDDELPPHKSYGDVITEKIGKARAAIVCWSAEAAQSEWVRAEADLARNQKKLIQTSYDNVMPPMPFNQIQYASLADWQGQVDHAGWRKVQASLADLCGPPGNARGEAPPVPPPYAAPPPPPPPPPAFVPPEPSAGRGLSPLVMGLVAGLLLVTAAAIAWATLGGDGQQAAESEIAQADSDDAPSGSAATRDDTGRYRLAAMIDDPDGYTNVRSSPESDGAIVAKVKQGEAFTTYEQPGNWWQVRTADGVTGFMARSRIRLIRDGVPVAPVSAVSDSGEEVAPADDWSDSPPDSGGRDGQIIPDSDTRRLTQDDIAALGPAQIRLARNEIYARKGRRFKNAALRNHFSRQSWYRPIADEVSLNPVEKANVDLLAAAETVR